MDSLKFGYRCLLQDMLEIEAIIDLRRNQVKKMFDIFWITIFQDNYLAGTATSLTSAFLPPPFFLERASLEADFSRAIRALFLSLTN